MPDPTIIMVAPNGARKTHKDHPALPVSIEETVNEAADCFAAGATVLHAHVRGKADKHVLEAGLYRELIDELQIRVPEMLIQMTTEAVGIYTPDQQIACVKGVQPEMISIALREISSDFQRPDFACEFFNWCDEANVHIQHILYSAEDLQQFLEFKNDDVIPPSHDCVLFVLGRYSVDFQSSPDDLEPFLQTDLSKLNWFTCAFGFKEQACVIAGIKQGGHARIGFENNLYQADGAVAVSTAAQVTDLVKKIDSEGLTIATIGETRRILGINLG
jgi:3-keto-5-aminohexanoate cleavage enzyme